jgi:hypothetical protein
MRKARRIERIALGRRLGGQDGDHVEAVRQVVIEHGVGATPVVRVRRRLDLVPTENDPDPLDAKLLERLRMERRVSHHTPGPGLRWSRHRQRRRDQKTKHRQ